MGKKEPVIRKQCGSVSGYQRHMRMGEDACPACREAKRLDSKQRRKEKPAPRGRAAQNRVRRKEGAELAKKEYCKRKRRQAQGKDDGYPSFLESAGRELWDTGHKRYEFDPVADTLFKEICRIADRMERLSAALASKSTLWFELGEQTEDLEDGIPVVVNNMISEHRQLAASYSKLLRDLGALEKASARREGASLTDQLKAKREARRRKAGEVSA